MQKGDIEAVMGVGFTGRGGSGDQDGDRDRRKDNRDVQQKQWPKPNENEKQTSGGGGGRWSLKSWDSARMSTRWGWALQDQGGQFSSCLRPAGLHHHSPQLCSLFEDLGVGGIVWNVSSACSGPRLRS